MGAFHVPPFQNSCLLQFFLRIFEFSPEALYSGVAAQFGQVMRNGATGSFGMFGQVLFQCLQLFNFESLEEPLAFSKLDHERSDAFGVIAGLVVFELALQPVTLFIAFSGELDRHVEHVFGAAVAALHAALAGVVQEDHAETSLAQVIEPLEKVDPVFLLIRWESPESRNRIKKNDLGVSNLRLDGLAAVRRGQGGDAIHLGRVGEQAKIAGLDLAAADKRTQPLLKLAVAGFALDVQHFNPTRWAPT